jgi:outer membrane receptor protein involved in Fe transport
MNMKQTRMNDPQRHLPQISPLTSAIRKGLIYGSVIAVSTSLAATPAFAQTSTGDNARESFDIEEVVVTATRRETTIFEVPYAISAISGKDIRRSGVQDLSDLVRVVPGIAYLEQGPRVANNNNYIILRGLNAASQSGAADTPFLAQPAVSTYFGNIPIFANFQTADLSRVEVLRGPQGTLYGSGSLGGTLRFIPNTPSTEETTFEVWGELSSTAHSGDLNYNTSAVWNQPISDTAALRFAAGYRELGGFIDYEGWVEPDSNGYPIPDGPFSWKTKPRQEDANDSTDWYFRGMGSFDITENFNLLLTWQHQDLEVDNRQSHSFEFESAGIDEEYVQLIPYEEPMSSEMDLLGMDIEINLGFATLSSSTSYIFIRQLSTGTQIITIPTPPQSALETRDRILSPRNSGCFPTTPIPTGTGWSASTTWTRTFTSMKFKPSRA